MRRILVVVFLLCGLARGAAATAEKTTGHGNAIEGTVVRVDVEAKTFVVRTAAGKQTVLVRTSATKINGQALRVGDRVAVRWLERDGRKVATSVRIEPPAVASATPTVPGSTGGH